MPTIFNVKIKNYFFGTLIGIAPQLFIIVSLGSGLEKVISQNSSPPTFFDIATSQEVYIPILAFIVLILIILFIKKKLILKDIYNFGALTNCVGIELEIYPYHGHVMPFNYEGIN